MEEEEEQSNKMVVLFKSQQRCFIWFGLVILALVWASTIDVPSSINSLKVENEESNNSENERTTPPPIASGSTLPTLSVISELRTTLADVQGEVVKMQKISAELVKDMKVTKLRMDRVEDAAFSDGSNAFVAVMENAFFSPTGKRWVKLCDWENCQFQTLAESTASLLKRTATMKNPVSGLRAIQLLEKCPREDNVYTAQLIATFGKERVAFAITNGSFNCTLVPTISASRLLDKISDKTLDAIVFEGNGQEDVVPILYSLLQTWSAKLRVGGIALGQDYVVTKPFNARWKQQIIATPHERATKLAIDSFRTSDDNELGQEDTVRVAGGSLWYFVKVKATIFG